MPVQKSLETYWMHYVYINIYDIIQSSKSGIENNSNHDQ